MLSLARRTWRSCLLYGAAVYHRRVPYFRDPGRFQCAEVFGSALEASVEFVDDIPAAPGGKFEAVKNSPEGRTAS
jgi:hypothetical protein